MPLQGDKHLTNKPFEPEKRLISVVVRTKDRPQSLRCALQSLAHQTLKAFEVIVINDGGENIGPLLDSFSASLTIRHHWFHSTRGRAIAGNAGIAFANGDWIAFLDDDDVYLPAGLQILADAAVDDNSVFYGRVPCYLYTGHEERRLFRTFGQDFDLGLMAYENFIPIIGALIPTEKVRVAGGIDEQFDCFEDWDLFYRLAQTVPFVFVDADVAEYRVTKNSFIVSQGNDEKQLDGHRRFYHKHWSTITPDLLSRMHHVIKTWVIPQESSLAIEPILKERNEIEAALVRAENESAARHEYIAGLETESEKRQAYIRHLETESEQRQAYIRHLETESEQRQAYIRHLETESEQRQAYIRHLETESEQRQAYIRHLETESEQRQAYIEHLEQANVDFEQTAKTLASRIAEHEAQIIELNKYQSLITEEIDTILVSVIIVNFNGKHHLERCLPSLLNTATVRFEIIVVDNGSADGSVSWLRANYPQIVLIPQECNLGFGRANLLAAWQARGQYIGLLNSDTVVQPDWLWHLHRALLLHHDVAVVCATLRLLDHPETLNARGGGMTRLGFGFDLEFAQPVEDVAVNAADRLTDVLFPSGAAMLMRREEFLGQFRFDPSFFMYHEDVDLGWRMWLLGRRAVVSEKSVVYHKFGGTTKNEKGVSWRALMGSRHNLRTLLKHYELNTLMPVLGELVRLWLAQRAYRTLFDTLFWNLLHLRGTARSRRMIQAERRRPDKELVDRGLIFQRTFPPSAPELPFSAECSADSSQFESPVLFPGLPSATSRLGYGWYPPEAIDGQWMRATCARATCRLHVNPGSRGVLVIEVMVPEAVAAEFTVNVTVNAVMSTKIIIGGRWREIEVPCDSGDRGVIDILFEANTWQPNDAFDNDDFRKLGLLVKSLRFMEKDTADSHATWHPTVLITTFNRRRVLEQTLSALENQSINGFEVVVVDDGSSDDTWKMLQTRVATDNSTYTLQVTRQKNTGQGIARNNGLELASGDLIVFLGDDIFPSEHWLAEHLAFHSSALGPCAVVGYTDWYRTGLTVTPLMEMVNTEGQQFGYGFMDHGEEVPYTCFYTSNLSIPKEFLGAQPFDPSFRTYGWEDLELGYRLTLRGLRTIYNRRAAAEHLHEYSVRSFFQRQRKVGENVHKLLAKHPELAACKFMPDFKLPIWFLAGRFLFLPFIPILSVLDRSGIQLPRPLLRRILLLGFLIGEQDGRETSQ